MVNETRVLRDWVGEEESDIPLFELLKLAWFKMLKNSLRNCSLNLSVIRKSLNSEKSRFHCPGPRPEFPTVSRGAALQAASIGEFFGIW